MASIEEPRLGPQSRINSPGPEPSTVSRAALQSWLGVSVCTWTGVGRWPARADGGVLSPPFPAIPPRSTAGHVLVGNAWLLCPCLACIPASLPRAQRCWRLQHFTSKVCLLPAPGCGSCTRWELPFPLVGAFQPFATSIPPVLDRSWGQNKPDSSCLPARLSSPPPTPDGWTVCWLFIGVGGFSRYPGLGSSPPNCN